VADANEPSGSNLILCARVLPEHDADLAQWRVRYQTAMLAAPGANSFQYWPPAPPDQEAAVLVGRFDSLSSLRAWLLSDAHRELAAEAAPLVEGGVLLQLAGQAAAEYYGRVTTSEIVITQIKPGQEAAYRAFADRIQRVQETFPGYLGSFVQPPHEKERGWTTVLRFDTPENLEGWLNSPQRASLLAESEPLILGFQAQRVDTSFPGWTPVDPVTGKSPSKWMTASLVLLTLFPVVMFEIRFLNPHLRGLPPALATFIGNSISVALTTSPLMPLAIGVFSPWLFPTGKPHWLARSGWLVVAVCYAIEIAVLWRLI
jgi:antibiotic biosynthesis monooxygenase (ABM) superfamily enzyme